MIMYLLTLIKEPSSNPSSRFNGESPRLIPQSQSAQKQAQKQAQKYPRSSASPPSSTTWDQPTVLPPDAGTESRSTNSSQPSQPLNPDHHQSFVMDWDFWIDLGLVVLSGGVSFVLLKLVECVVLTDAIVGGF